MGGELRLLVVEDSEDDTLLLVRELERAGYGVICERVESAAAMRVALAKTTWDVIIADYTMPQFSATQALALLKEVGLDLPFIIVSGTIGEERAVAAMKAGAHDYVMKGNLARLVPALERELREAEIRQARKEADERYRILYEDNPSMYLTVDEEGTVLSVNRFGANQLGYSPEEVVARSAAEVVHAEDRSALRRQLRACLNSPGEVRGWEFRKVRKDGQVIWVNESARATQDASGKTIVLIVGEDVTARRQAEAELERARDELEGKVERQMQVKNTYGLTFRELSVLHLVAGGQSDKEIAAALGISRHTVNAHVGNILEKMGAASRTEASARAVREGLVA